MPYCRDMGEHTNATRVMSADPETVLATVVDIEAYPRWTSQITRAEVFALDAAGMPSDAELRMDAGLLKDVLRLSYRVTRRGPEAEVAWTLVAAKQLRSLEGSYRIVPAAQGCTVTYTLNVDPGIPIITALRRKAEATVVSVALDDLAREVERRNTERAHPE